MLNTKITIKMLHLLWFSSYHLLPVLCHKSKVAYSSSEIGPSSPADWTSNLENHASRYSNNQQAFMGSTSVCICPPLLQYPCGNVHHAHHSQNQFSGKKSGWELRKWIFTDILHPRVSNMRIEVLPEDPCSYLLFYFIGSL